MLGAVMRRPTRQVRDVGKLARFLDSLQSLKVVRITGNPCFPQGGNRVELLSNMSRAAAQGFSLLLNGVAVTLMRRLEP